MGEQFQVFAATMTSTAASIILDPGTAATHVLRTLTLCNPSTTSTTSATVTLYMANESASYTLFKYTQVTAAHTLLPATSPLVVSAGNRLEVSGGASDIDVSATYLELT